MEYLNMRLGVAFLSAVPEKERANDETKSSERSIYAKTG